jgi:uncharacterized DUF497 family protein
MARTEVPAHAREGPFLTRAPLRSLSPVFDRRCRVRGARRRWYPDAVPMGSPTFDWDRAKAAANRRKHGVAFDEAVSVFQDPLAKVHADPLHSAQERREIIIGHSGSGRLLLVAFTERRSRRIRIISARAATRRERKAYEEDQEHT